MSETIQADEPKIEDVHVIRAMKRWGGSFVFHLAQAATVADEFNMARIKAAFPEYWKQYTETARRNFKEIA